MREVIPSLANTLPRCHSTVRELMNSCAPIRQAPIRLKRGGLARPAEGPRRARFRGMTMFRRPDRDAVHHPVVAQQLTKQAEEVQLRIADLITRFAGSMLFVYLHVAAFAIWMLVLEQKPWPTLTLVVSLEAIFLSTFVMIGQNRQAAFQQQKADHDFIAQEQELHTNTELTRGIERLTREIHGAVLGTGSETGPDRP